MSSETLQLSTESEARLLEGQAAESRALGRLEETESLLRQALDLREQDGSTDRIELTSPIDHLGHALRDQGKLDEAMAFYDRAFEIRQSLLGAEHIEVAISFDNRATIFRARGDLDRAEALLQESLSLRRSKLDSDDVLIADTLSFLAQLDLDQNRPLEAEQKLVSVAEMRRQALGMAHGGYLESLSTLTSFYGRTGRLTAVELLADEVIQQAEDSLGQSDIGTARIQAIFVEAYCGLDAASAAAELLGRALPIFKSELGEEQQRPEVHRLIVSCLSIFLKQGRLEYAEPVLQMLVEHDTSAFGSEDPRVAQSIEQLANLKCSLGQPAEAIDLFERCLEIHRGLDDEQAERANDLRILTVLADLEAQAGDFESVDRRLRELLTIQEQELSQDAPQTLSSLRRLGGLNLELGRIDEALSFYGSLVKRQSRALIAQDQLEPDTVSDYRATLQILIALRLETQRLGEAEEAFDQLACSWQAHSPVDLRKAIKLREQLLGMRLQESRLADAEPVLKDLLSLRRETFGEEDSSVVNTLIQLANLKSEMGNAAEEEEWLVQLLGLLQGIDPPDTAQTLDCLGRLAVLAERSGQDNKIESWQRQILDFCLEKELYEQAARSLSSLSGFLLGQDRIDETSVLIEESLERQRRDSGWDQPLVAAVLLDLKANICRQRSRLFESEQCYRESLELRASALGATDPEVGISLYHLADQYADEGRFEESEDLYLQSLKLQQGSSPPVDACLLAETREGLAELYFDMGKPEAEALFRRVIDEKEAAFGVEALQVADSLGALAKVLHEKQQTASAEPLLERALRIYEGALPANHPQLATAALSWGAVLCDLRRFEAAGGLLERALNLRVENLGEMHRNVGTVHNQIGLLKMAMGDWDAAEEAFTKAQEIGTQSLPISPVEQAIILSNMATLRRSQNRLEESIALHQEVLQIRERSSGPADPEVAVTLFNLADVYLADGDPAAAESLLLRAIEMFDSSPERGRKIPVAYDLLAAIYNAMGHFQKAAAFARRSLDIRQQELDADHVEVGYSLLGLATSEHLEGETEPAAAHYQQCLELWQQHQSELVGPQIAEVRRRYDLLISGSSS